MGPELITVVELERRIEALERILSAVLRCFRQTAIMELGAIEDAARMPRTILPKAERKREA